MIFDLPGWLTLIICIGWITFVCCVLALTRYFIRKDRDG